MKNICLMVLFATKIKCQCPLRPLHTESEIFLKYKYDLTLCQSRLHTASDTFVRHQKIRIRIFRICSKHFERCFDNSEPPYKRTPKSRMVKFIHFVSQHKAP